jgi:hypothetical protein
MLALINQVSSIETVLILLQQHPECLTVTNGKGFNFCKG